MTAKRIFLGLLTLVAAASVFLSLFESWNQPQFQSRLTLYETDLLLQASEWQGAQQLNGSGEKPVQTALEAYQKTRKSTEGAIATLHSRIDDPSSPMATAQLRQQQSLLNELDVRIGVLQAQENQVAAAIATWSQLKSVPSAIDPVPEPPRTVRSTLNQRPVSTSIQNTASVLSDLWSKPAKISPKAEPILKQNLNGWFRYQGLAKLYDLQQRSEDLAQLRTVQQQSAQQAFLKWAGANAVPAIAIVIGIGVLIFLIAQRAIRGKQALLAGTDAVTWAVPWDWEIIWQVLIVGFFFVGQVLIGALLLPIGLGIAQSVFHIESAAFSVREKSLLSLSTYVLLAAGGLGVLYGSIRSFLPLPEGWFRFSLRGNWFWWGLGGYAAAYPLVVAVSWVNSLIWQGRGGSNPILSVALEGRDPIALMIFLATAAIAAPLFEETFFRGFLLSSLTKYFSTWQSILLSSLIFAVVHLSLSEVLPLMTLGIILGFVYTRTQNLMASILLHALWNSGTLVTLFLLGGSGA
ncbi:CPBP family intramembrane glutamic endopeptidase [Myxacorys almedinensis]|uniref:CPBP family intramembrane metalloprotease n=1 Tax=Myxacorys almedinensis A TaxID=2690445 RepID=A0A8J7Z817_9CYAN|nr:type II CAAX endopeptidase family protein [Myxacorys almedinensis]NDJ19631.1 CPBP family intramembrane metalloprotease [Myxacorys almedinensis A]